MIASIFAAAKQQLETVLHAAGEQPPTHELGAWHAAEAASPPRILWVIDRGRVEPTKQAGNSRTALGVRELSRRVERILVHVWAESVEAVELLMNHFVAACRAVASDYSFRALETDWTVGQAEVAPNGRLCILTIEVVVPFTAEPVGVSEAPHVPTIVPQLNAPQ